MVKNLIFKNSSGTIIQEEAFDYKYPEDWESIMDPGGDYSIVSPPKGFEVRFIVYDIKTETVIYKCRRLNNGS